MKVEDLKIVEARMNPTSFAQAIKQGQQAGVLVGFEFEVIVDTEKRKQIVQGASVEPGAPYQVPFGTQTILKFCQEFGRNTNPSVLNLDKYIEARRPLNESGVTGLGATYVQIQAPAIIAQALEQIVDNASEYIAQHMTGDFSSWPDSRTYSGSRPELLARLKEILTDAGIPVGSQEFNNFALEPDTSAVRRMEAFRTLQDAVNILTDRFKQLQVGSDDNLLYTVKYQWRDDPESEWSEQQMQVVARNEREAQNEAQDKLRARAYRNDARGQFRDTTVVGTEPVPVDANGQQPWQTEQGKQTIIDYNLVYQLWRYLWSRDSLRRSFYLDHTEFRRQFANWIEQRYGLKRMADLVCNGGTVRGQQIPPGLKVVQGQDQAVTNISGGRAPDWNPNRNAGRDGYRAGAEFIKSLLEPIVPTPVHIFTSYHQSRKNLTDYYIEPDGSLRPRPGDSSAEVVTPPLPPVDAMNMLNKFFAMAKSNGMYTGKDHVTGLHINVSIPKQLDVLKLAMFVGDEYVLKQFGRENAQYVHSIYKHLLNNNAPAPGISQEQRMQYVKRIASDFANSHGASTSFESGNYISFRHAGGDYLNDPTLVNNTVGRFVRAMIIASDPAAYRNEYLTKVTKLVEQMRTQHGRLRRPPDMLAARQRMQQLVQNGLRGASAVFFQWENASSLESLQLGLRSQIPFGVMPDGVFIEPGTEADRQTLAAARGWSRDTKEKLLAAPLDQIKRAQLIFNNQDPDQGNNWDGYGKATGLRDRGGRIGAVVYQPLVLPPADPRVRALARQTLSGAVAGPQGTLPESQDLDEIDRRGFLRTMGAGAMAAAGVPAAQAKTKLPEPIDLLSIGSANKDAEEMLHRTAKAAGIRGVELAQFLAQCWHESYGFKHMQELGDSKYFLRYDPRYEPAKARQLGNIRPGDGERYKGRGFIQITGRDNYRRAGEALGLPLEQRPELASRPDIAARIAIWYWKSRVRPNVANFNDTRAVTRQINPVMRGLQDRHENFKDYKNVFNV